MAVRRINLQGGFGAIATIHHKRSDKLTNNSDHSQAPLGNPTLKALAFRIKQARACYFFWFPSKAWEQGAEDPVNQDFIVCAEPQVGRGLKPRPAQESALRLTDLMDLSRNFLNEEV